MKARRQEGKKARRQEDKKTRLLSDSLEEVWNEEAHR
jgi:hypothetical protein